MLTGMKRNQDLNCVRQPHDHRMRHYFPAGHWWWWNMWHAANTSSRVELWWCAHLTLIMKKLIV